jgi:hypothetical protein
MPDNTDSNNINPQVRRVDIGKRTLRKISIYPLSLADQLSLTEMITAAIEAFFKTNPDESDESMVQFVSFMLELIKENIDKILEMITDEGKEVLNDITNAQLMDIAEVVYRDNYEGPVGKAMSLFERERPAETESQSKKPLRRVVRPMDTGSGGSTDAATEKAASL